MCATTTTKVFAPGGAGNYQWFYEVKNLCVKIFLR